MTLCDPNQFLASLVIPFLLSDNTGREFLAIDSTRRACQYVRLFCQKEYVCPDVQECADPVSIPDRLMVNDIVSMLWYPGSQGDIWYCDQNLGTGFDIGMLHCLTTDY